MTSGPGTVRCIAVRSAAEHCGENPCGKLLFTVRGEYAALAARGVVIQRECPRSRSRICTVRLDGLVGGA